MDRRMALGGVAVLAVIAIAGAAFVLIRDHAAGPASLQGFSLDHRPQSDRYLFDYAGSLSHYEEGANRFLRRMSERFHIEALIVTLPALPERIYPEALAADIVNRWRIGGNYDGRGLLLLLVEQDKQVKLEVTYELEDVFTDAFTGYVEDLQLRPYYLAEDIGTGLVAVMEELEQRAQLKQQSKYTPGLISKLDDELLAGGAGTRRSLERYEENRKTDEVTKATPAKGPSSPEQAWNVMLAKWAGEGAHIDLDVYTELSKLAMGDPDDPDPRTQRSVSHWRTTDYQVRQDHDHAVIWFGNIKGWDNAPFLFCRTPNGWKFDIVHQRRLVVMQENPRWVIEQGDYPYVGLLTDARQSTGKDLPLPVEYRYRCRDDARIARRIGELEAARRDSPDDIGVLMELARLNIITGRRPNQVMPLLKQLRALAADEAEIHKDAAIYHVNTFFQYSTALKEMRAYVTLRPDDPFGHNFVGFLHYRLGDYAASIESLERALKLAPDSVYAYSLLARNYVLLYRKASSDSSQRHYRERALAMLENARSSPTPDPIRVAHLHAWLDSRLR